MYLPYRKAYLTGMNPLSFVTFFTFGELGTISALAVAYTGLRPLWLELLAARSILFWLMLGGFIWVIGDLFQQYAAKYIGISRGIPLSNTNQLWGLLWGIFVFGELRGHGASLYAQVIGGSLLMMAGVAAISLSSATAEEQSAWREAAQRESRRYSVSSEFIEARLQGLAAEGESTPRRTALDWLLVLGATAVFFFFAFSAHAPQIPMRFWPALLLTSFSLLLLLICGFNLRRTTNFR
jgi:Sugar transport protein